MGAVALGTMAVGALAIGRLAVGRARIRRMEIGDLLVQRLRVIDKGRPPPSSPSAANSHGIVNLASPYPFPETVSRLQSAFVDHGIKIFATVDQQAEALAACLEMPPTTLIIFGNPKSGTPVMLAQPLSALDLPLKVLVSEPIAGRVSVSFNATAYLIDRYALPQELASALAPAEQLIAGALQV